jgi:hypothetical protein
MCLIKLFIFNLKAIFPMTNACYIYIYIYIYIFKKKNTKHKTVVKDLRMNLVVLLRNITIIYILKRDSKFLLKKEILLLIKL